MACLALKLLGPFQATLDGQAVEFATDKVRALLAYLAVESDLRPHARESLAGLLWPDYAETSARQSLTQALFSLRTALGDRAKGDLTPGDRAKGDRAPGDRAAGPAFLRTKPGMVQFNGESDHWLDVAALSEDLTAIGELSPAEGIARLEEAVGLYRGPFLEGFTLGGGPRGDSAPFEEWVTLKREECLRRVLKALHRLVDLHEHEGRYEDAERWARREVELEPSDEGAQRQLMRALALGGQRNAALAQYEACRRLLADELGVEPGAETTTLYEAIRHGLLGKAPAASPPLASPPDSGAPVVAEEEPEPPHPLFVAREQELAHLEQWLSEALRGQGRVGFVVGEPGSGKTALLRAFARRAMDAYPDLIVAGGNCNAYAGLGDPYLPFMEILLLLTGDAEGRRVAGALSREHARRLQAIASVALEAVLQNGPTLIDALLPGAALLERARALPDGAAWAARVQQALDHRVGAPSQAFLFDQVTRVLEALARDHPLLLILDDLQWADTGSISLLFHLGRRLGRILVLGAYRPEEVALGREGQPHPLQSALLELGTLWEENQVDLAQADECSFVEALVDSEPNRLGAAFREALCRHTGGHALFTVELLHGLEQRGDLLRDDEGRWIEAPALDWDRLPRRVESVIAAHMARLPREQQELLSVASVEGEEFHAEVAARVLQRNETEVLAALSGPLSQEHRLVRAQSLRQVEVASPTGGASVMGSFSRYRFRHYLFQQYLYQRLDAVLRAHLHRDVAGALEALGVATASTMPDWMDTTEYLTDNYNDLLGSPEGIISESQMAWHWEQAGFSEKAALYHVRAARRLAKFSFARREILSHVTTFLDLFAALPESPRRARYEQYGYHMLGWIWSDIKGLAAPEVGQGFRKSLEIAEKIGDKQLVADVLSSLCSHYCARGEMDTALALVERAVELARGGPPGWVMSIGGALAMVVLYRGDYARAARLLAPLSEVLLRTGSILPWASSISLVVIVPWALWCLGYADQALRVGQAAQQMVLREKDGFAFDQEGNVYCSAICFTHRLRREVQGVQQGLRLLQSLIDENRCAPWVLSMVMMYRGWVHTYTGQMEQGITELREVLADRREGIMGLPTHQSGYLAEALARAGRVDEGLRVLEEALAEVERTGVRFGEPELHRLKGELLLQRGGDPGEVEACFRRAIAVAQGQEAKSWELRATTSLARLLQQRGQRAEARRELAAIHGWFTEGYDTPDLQEAKALLGALS